MTVAALVLAVLVFAGVAVGVIFGFQRRLIYFPWHSVPPVARVLPGWSEATLRTDDGLELGAWYCPPDARAPVVVVFNGNAGNRAARAAFGARLVAEGLGVLLWDYRGYGGNAGSPSEQGLARDARAAAAFVDRYAEGHPVVYFGESLGAGVAVELAIAQAPDALVLRSPFTSLADVGAVHYPFLPVRPLIRDRYPSLDRIAAVGAPLLVIAGDRDSIVPLEQSRRLYEAAPEPKAMKVIERADHNDAALFTGDELISEVVGFIQAHVGR